MTDATPQSHPHAHDHTVGRQHAPASVAAQRRAVRAARLSLLESSAASRLLGASVALGALWLCVFWALH